MKRIIPLNEYQIALVEENVSVINQVVSSRIITNNNVYGLEYDDLFQEGCLFLCDAAMKYDEKRNCEFKFFAYKVILNGLISYCKKINKKTKDKFSYIEKIKKSSEMVLDDDIFLQEKIVEIDVLFFLENIKKQYTGTVELGIDAMILKIQGFTNADIAKLYNVKPNLIGARISRALKKLQENSVFNKYMEELFGEQ